MRRKLLGLVLLALCSMAWSEEFDAKVIAVMDGDTVMVLRDGQKVKVRLANIDAPESDQAYGKESRQALLDSVLHKQVHINSQAVDNYGRMVAEVSVDGRSVNEAQVRNGMAWEYSHFHRNKRYLALNKQAQAAQRGLWGQSVQPINPQQWRKTHPSQPHTQSTLSKTAAAHVNSACGRKHLCRQMISCEEAKIYYLQCGVKSLDGNGDGVPCENLCGGGHIQVRNIN